jgi:hypothetical protein
MSQGNDKAKKCWKAIDGKTCHPLSLVFGQWLIWYARTN